MAVRLPLRNDPAAMGLCGTAGNRSETHNAGRMGRVRYFTRRERIRDVAISLDGILKTLNSGRWSWTVAG